MDRAGDGVTASIFESPEWFVRDMDWDGGRALCVPMSRETYARSVFLDHRIVTRGGAGDLEVPIGSLMEAWQAARPAPQPIAFIAHMALCGSTFLARCLDTPGQCLAYREPYPLHALSGPWRTGGQRDIQARLGCPEPSVLELNLSLLQRSFSASERPLVKLTDSCTSLLPAMLKARPGSRLLLLYQALPRYLATMMSDPERRQFARRMLTRAHLDLVAAGKRELVTGEPLGDARCIAYVWLSLMYPYRRLLSLGPSRVRSLDAVRLFDRPEGTVVAAGRFFRLGLSRQAITERLAGGIMGADAKDTDRRFDRARRQAELEAVRDQYRAEIDDALDWVDAITADDPLPAELPNSLPVR